MTHVSQTPTQVQAEVAKRIWCAISRGVNHPQMCSPSIELVEELAKYYPFQEVPDHIWRLWKSVTRTCHLPGFSRPLGSCYHPSVADLLDVVYNYGHQSREVFRRINKAAGTIATTLRGKWRIGYEGSLQQEASSHISRTPGLVSQLAHAVRTGTAPAVEAIDVNWFEPNWSTVVAETIVLAERVTSLPWLPYARYYQAGQTLEVTEYFGRSYQGSYSRDVDTRREDRFPSPVQTDGQSERSEEWQQQRLFYNNHASHTLSRNVRITDATYALERSSDDGSIRRVILWPGHNLDQVAIAIDKGYATTTATGHPDFDEIFEDVMVNVQGLSKAERKNLKEAVKLLSQGAPIFRPHYNIDQLLLAAVTAERLLRERRLTFHTDYRGDRKSAVTADDCRRVWLTLLSEQTPEKVVTQVSATLAALGTSIEECRATADKPWPFGKTMYLEVFDGTFHDYRPWCCRDHRTTDPRNCIGGWDIDGSYVVEIEGRGRGTWSTRNLAVLRIAEAAKWGIDSTTTHQPRNSWEDILLIATEQRQPRSIATIFVETEPQHSSMAVEFNAGAVGHTMAIGVTADELKAALAAGLPMQLEASQAS